jgi:DNA-binding response OmpR family regulator
LHILVVEDDPRVANFSERGLRAEGYRVSLARNGPDALSRARELDQEICATAEPAAILLHLMLPVTNGIEVSRPCGRRALDCPS